MADWNFSELVQTLWRTCADNGVGALLRPGQKRRDAYADADAKRIIAQGERDATQILSGEKTLADFQLDRQRRIASLEQRLEPEFDLDALPAIVLDQHTNDLLRKEVNVAKALLHAEEELQQDSSPSPEKTVDGDWIRRWRDIVGNVSGEDLQSLWGRLLAGEIKTPGKHSLRTLDIIRNISSEDAQLIAKLAPYALNGFIWNERGVDQHITRAGLQFSDLLYCEEIGIVTGVTSALTNQWTAGSKPEFSAFIVSGNLGLRVTHEDRNATLTMRGMALTRAGAQILDLCQSEEDDMYLRELGVHFKSKGFKSYLGQTSTNSNGDAVLIKLEEL